MSTPINDGGAAFPSLQKVREDHPDGQLHWIQAGGMTLRDYFAGQALAGMCAGITRFHSEIPDIIVNRPNDLSEIAFVYADAMLAAREGAE